MNVALTSDELRVVAPLSYDVIVSDPPWPFDLYSSKGAKKSASEHYPVMTVAAIAALNVAHIAQRDCILLLWATAPRLPDAFAVMAAWGFAYKTNLVWRKTTANGKVRMGTGYWARTMHEQILVGTLGRPSKFSAFPSLFDGVAREHSRKPEEFYGLVEKHTVGMRRIELFSRTPREGWDTWGLEARKFTATPSTLLSAAQDDGAEDQTAPMPARRGAGEDHLGANRSKSSRAAPGAIPAPADLGEISQ